MTLTLAKSLSSAHVGGSFFAKIRYSGSSRRKKAPTEASGGASSTSHAKTAFSKRV
jgi:hypothetical protein